MKDHLDDVEQVEGVDDELRPYLELALLRARQFMGLSEHVAEHGDEDLSLDHLLAPMDQPTPDPAVVTLSIREAADELGTSPDTLRKVASVWATMRDTLPTGPAPFRTTGDSGHRTWRFPSDVLWAWWHEATELVHAVAREGVEDPPAKAPPKRRPSETRRSSARRSASEVEPLPTHAELEARRRRRKQD